MNFSFHNLYLILSLILTAAAGGILDVRAQTCRISCTSATPGHTCIKEVYEYDFVTEKPSFPGGSSSLLEFLNSNRKYPEEAYKKKVQGRVTCQFIVNADGSVSDIQLLRGVHPSLNREAIRLFSIMPEWKPGRHKGKAVPVRVIWSVPFRR